MSLIKSTSLVLVGLWASLSTATDVPAYNDAFIVECDPANNVVRIYFLINILGRECMFD